MLLADEFYLIAHADTSGQLRLHPKVAGYGVASALLGELILMGRADVDAGMVRVASSHPPQDVLAHTVLDLLLSEPAPLPVRDWLAFLGRTSVEDVAQRLVRIGVLEQVKSRMPRFGSQRRYSAVSVNEAAWPAARITTRLMRREQMDPPDRVLAAIVHATGLSQEMLWDDQTGASRRYLRSVIAELPESLRSLVSETEIAVSKVALTRT